MRRDDADSGDTGALFEAFAEFVGSLPHPPREGVPLPPHLLSLVKGGRLPAAFVASVRSLPSTASRCGSCCGSSSAVAVAEDCKQTSWTQHPEKDSSCDASASCKQLTTGAAIVSAADAANASACEFERQQQWSLVHLLGMLKMLRACETPIEPVIPRAHRVRCLNSLALRSNSRLVRTGVLVDGGGDEQGVLPRVRLHASGDRGDARR